MNVLTKFLRVQFWIFSSVVFSIGHPAQADVITDWNITARNIVVESKLYAPPANRVMAIVHTAVYKSVNSITQEFPKKNSALQANQEASVEAAVAAANYTSLIKLLPDQHLKIKEAYVTALELIPDGAAKESGISIGVIAAETVLAERSKDGSELAEVYRPHSAAGKYVPTVIPAVPQWPNRRPWLLSSASQFRPIPPPTLDSQEWAKDFNEVKEIGEAESTVRNQQQTEIAKFWEATSPAIYHGIVHSVAKQTGRTATQNARLFAIVTQAIDDAMIAVFEAKYYYAFWRPITAIRNADIDNNDATERDASWKSYIPTPMHPEYPCAHCVVAGTVGAILKAEVGENPMPLLTTRSDTANNAMRSWPDIESFVQEVSEARIYDGVHYRSSTVVGSLMGEKIGELAVRKHQGN
ncbi:vanadium-dependent haloperoxidase [Aliiglaciecola sp. M165]|uniref:vanadium-dependent haloperoxidase n=1 Tax=Aliiglaciecola sp. M165 TaxID=2593649 RepID=UPI00117C2A0C|nr:vanadium-dependent haloperoxidase [Aliiglaciecola sp. M165]TRY32990.1 vanadium-dependent haloperoxidase [Aliiglaciecola sp. M165]